jgi:very-short-patch-repair endonuclease
MATRALWQQWLQHAGHEFDDALVSAAPARATPTWLTTAARAALTGATASPQLPRALLVSAPTWRAWAARSGDRLRAFLEEGVIEVTARAVESPPPAPPRAAAPSRSPLPGRTRAPALERARSRAELALHAALEADRSTAGRFALNESVSFVFGARAAEVDLLSRGDEIAIEVDGYHHFTDAEHYRRDRRKDLLLQANGYTVLRFLAEDLERDPADAVRAVIEILGARRRRDTRGRGRSHP